jgi:DnaK suppressor protein
MTIRDDLVAHRAKLAAELERLTAPPKAGATVSFGKRIGDGTTEAVERLSTTATARSISHSIDEIDRVLVKIDDGTYGLCDRCGRAIDAERLDARPATTACVTCAGM